MNKYYKRFCAAIAATVIAAVGSVSVFAAPIRYVGGDISLLPEYEKAGAEYYDHEGKRIASLLPFLHVEGMNAMRVRLFVDPAAYTGPSADPNACQDLGYILPLCKRIKEDGFALMLDFHYSDTWADPSSQWTPAAWQGQTDEELSQTLTEYTRSVLRTLEAEGCAPDFIQPGNEVSYGMLWGRPGSAESGRNKLTDENDEAWERFGKLLRSAVGVCREVCPNAKIILHTERTGDSEALVDFYRRMSRLAVDYDIIGLSYYPYFHGDMKTLDTSLSKLSATFSSREIMIVETGFPYAWEVPGTTQSVDYPYTESGQDEFARELVATLRKYDRVTGLFWWWMEYNAKGTSLEGWYNAPLFDSRTGRATPALRTICSFLDNGDGMESLVNEYAGDNDDKWYNMQGIPVEKPTAPGLYLHGGRKTVLAE